MRIIKINLIIKINKKKTIDLGVKRKNTGQFILGQAHLVLFS